ncbi:MAG: ABC transporter permease subunit [Anaerolineae bacterium]|nr:ABC transporter permease subunit [Anaerolineae bacterium]
MAVPLSSKDSTLSQTITPRTSTWRNIARFLLVRIATLALAVVAAVYLTIIIANFGGYVDTIIASRIEEQVGFMLLGGWLSDLPSEERLATAEQTIAAMQDAAGLNDPFLVRSARWLGDGLTLNWGEPERARAYGLNAGGKSVGGVIVDNLSRSLLVFGTANVFVFGVSVFIALALNRRQGSLVDRVFILLSPISAAPAWVYGILLTVFSLRFFGFSPGGTFDTLPGDLRWAQLVVLGRHLLLPFIAILLSGLFQTVFIWRSYFQTYSHEDYVDMAYAKGMPKRLIDRRYIIRPALPALLTSFGLLVVLLWQELIALEYFFNVQGLGRLFITALNIYDTPMIVAVVTTFAYLVAITVLLLDILYVVIDPRVRVGSEKEPTRNRGEGFGRFRFKNLHRPKITFPSIHFADLAAAGKRLAQGTWRTLEALRHYPSAVIGLVIIGLLLLVSVYTVFAIPYSEAVSLWRGDGDVWIRNPRDAFPTWVNWFRSDDLPPTFAFSSADSAENKQTTAVSEGTTEVVMPFTFDYDYGDYPQEIVVDVTAQYEERGPHVTIWWTWPDGRERELTSFQPRSAETYYVSRDDRLKRRLRSDFPLQALFQGPEGDSAQPLPGTYTLRIEALHFEPDSDLDVDVTIMGQVYGLAGTDTQRRDLMIALLWGTPVALTFGIILAVTTSVGSMLIAAAGAWYGGLVDRIIQLLTEISLILPAFAVSLMVFTLYSRSIVVILVVTVLLTVFGRMVKTYRATFLQVRSAPYIEAARAYGAGDGRIVVRYMLPRIVTVLIPQLIIMVPTFVFLEATLAFLGLTDPLLPTWGKLVVAALSYGVHTDAVHLVIAPLALLFITGFAFAMVGIALERVFEPRLRES